MEHIFPPLTILAGNLVAALVLAIVKDVVNNLVWGETQVVLQKLTVFHHPTRPETPHLEITGRRAGFAGYLLTLLDLSPRVTLTANGKEIRKSTSSLHGHTLDVVPLSESISVQAESERSMFWLLAAMVSLTGGVASGLLMGVGYTEKVLNGVAWVVSSAIFLFAFYQSHRFQLIVHGTLRAGVSFKPSILEGRAIQFKEVLEATEVLVERIHESRMLQGSPAMAMGPAPTMYVPTPVPQVAGGGPQSTKIVPPNMVPPAIVTPTILPSGNVPKSPPMTPYVPAAGHAFDDSDETLNEIPFPPIAPANAPAANQPQAPVRANTGTVEYGEDQPAFEAEPAAWNGPEPGTSDSIQLRQAITRSATGMFLGVTGKIQGMEDDEDELDSVDSDSAVPPHRGTVSWEEHADKTQDEMRAEAELADLKRSRPKRGEAKFRLRDLMRRFPQTEAANKARRMLERLESGQ